MTIDTVTRTLWDLLLDALDGDDPAEVYALAAAFGLVTEMCSPGDQIEFDTADDLVRVAVRRLLTSAAEHFTAGHDDAGLHIAEAAWRLVEVTGIQVGG